MTYLTILTLCFQTAAGALCIQMGMESQAACQDSMEAFSEQIWEQNGSPLIDCYETEEWTMTIRPKARTDQ